MSLAELDIIDKIIVVIHPDDKALYSSAIPLQTDKLLEPVYGGETRQKSVYNGLKALSELNPLNVLIHDAARPFLLAGSVFNLIHELENSSGALLAIPLADTLKKVNLENNLVNKTIPRFNLWRAQTPQAFNYKSIIEAHEKAALELSLEEFTDDASIAEWYGLDVKVVMGSDDSRKLTTPEDLVWAQQLLEAKNMRNRSSIRIGSGYDVHAFEEGDSVILCGHSIPFNKSLKGHSDADVAMHALTDAIFGALADGDIGSHFPPSDPQWKGAASDQFLKYAVNRVLERSGSIQNLDVTIICEAPKVGPHREVMRENLSRIMDLDIKRISVKATTSERLGFTGREEGIASMATVAILLPDQE